MSIPTPTPARPTSLQEAAAIALAREPSRHAFEFNGRWITYGEVRALADQIGVLLDRSGADPAAPVAFLARMRPECLTTLLQLLKMSRIVRMLYTYQSSAAIAADIKRLRPAVAIGAAEDFGEPVLAQLREQGVAAIALDGMRVKSVEGLDHSANDFDRAAPSTPRIEILTSGTTGAPKHFPLDYERLMSQTIGANSVYAADVDTASLPPFLSVLPLGNIGGIYGSLPAMLHGVRIMVGERFTFEKWYDYTKRYPSRVSILPPAGVRLLLDSSVTREDLKGVRYFVCGAAPVDPASIEEVRNRFGISIMQSYGATEFGGVVATMTPDLTDAFGPSKSTSVGRPFGDVQIRITDPESNRQLPPGEVGLVHVLAPRMSSEWKPTSDLGYLDEDGFLYLRGRADGAIIRGGFKLLPDTITNALLTHPAILAAVVVGIAERRLGQVPVAALQSKAETTPPSFEELESFLRDRLPSTHIPVAWRWFDPLPRNPSLKPDLLAIRAIFEREMQT
jgi:acyl-CoA synthetase (AMP-forming)/AMP-acid ligase II